MKTAIVAGCAGLLGSHFSRHLISKGYKVIGIDDLSGGYKEYLPTQDLTDLFDIGCYHYYFRHTINPELIYLCHRMFEDNNK
tara:strand:- start:1329 stop:1574 length:246 start_codon:yes stop_codon:yes gene_type:complete